MKKNHLVKYLLISPSLPVGGFCYSEGLESFLKIKKQLPFQESLSIIVFLITLFKLLKIFCYE